MAEKKKRVKYDINLLTTFCIENNIELLKDYSGENITQNAGYECEIWVYNSKGEKVETYM